MHVCQLRPPSSVLITVEEIVRFAPRVDFEPGRASVFRSHQSALFDTHVQRGATDSGVDP
jgi:hypothetical protein